MLFPFDSLFLRKPYFYKNVHSFKSVIPEKAGIFLGQVEIPVLMGVMDRWKDVTEKQEGVIDK